MYETADEDTFEINFEFPKGSIEWISLIFLKVIIFPKRVEEDASEEYFPINIF